MALVTKEFKLDLAPGKLRPVLYASQGDIGRPFMARCYWNGATWDADAYTVNIRGRKPDETVFDYTATADGSTVTFETTEQMTIISGPVECELVFSNDGDIIASANFLLIVEASPYDPDALSESDVLTLADAVAGMMDDAIDEKLDAYEAGTDNLTDGAVTTAKLADNSVTSDKIKDGEVKTADIADANVTNAKLADNAVTSDKIADGAVNTVDIANNAVTAAKLDEELRAAITEIQEIIRRGITTGGVLFSQGALTFSQGRLYINDIN